MKASGILTGLLAGLILAVLVTGTASGQASSTDYRYAVGLRAGGTSGFTFNFDVRNSADVGLLAGFWGGWFSMTALYEKYHAPFNVEGLRWFYGGGGHISIETRDRYHDGWYYRDGNDFGLGIDGVVGIIYKIPPVPIAVSTDFKPFIEMDTHGHVFFGPDFGIGVKFTF